MEHVTDPAAAFAEIYRMLRPGGVVFHEYNPFFSIDGGHSLCTLDFLWGHARLSDEDFLRYLDENRPGEKALALSFYRNNLNRMTLSGLDQYITEAGFSMLSVLPWPRRKYLHLLDRSTLAQCVRVYPAATVTDLISPVVWVLLQK
jgi:ubiquinone/menaquinone biosynthesis C-methylase UbiE